MKKLWLAPIHPNNLWWNSNSQVDPGHIVGAMAQLRNIWRATSCQHTLHSEALLLTALLYNPTVPDSLTFPMSSPWAMWNLFHFGHLVDPRTQNLLPLAYFGTDLTFPCRELTDTGYWVLTDPPLRSDHRPYFTILPLDSFWETILEGPSRFNFRSIPDIKCLSHTRSR